MISRSRIDHLSSNGGHCIDYLLTLMQNVDYPESNRVYNHAVAVRGLVECVRKLYLDLEEARALNSRILAENTELKEGIYNKYIASKVAEIKGDLIEYIQNYGEVDY